VKPPADLPEAPRPRVPVAPPPPQQTQPAPSQLEPVKPVPPNPNLKLGLPSANVHDQLEEAIQHSTSGGRIQVPDGGDIPRGPGGPGGPGMQPGAAILTPTEGVDFSSYIQRLLAILKVNWYAVTPVSAEYEKGIVGATFQINRDGSVTPPDPLLVQTSGKDPLDNAAMTAIRISKFEPLPSQFKGPYIRLQIGFYYNIPLPK